jgi:hypothetical protein
MPALIAENGEHRPVAQIRENELDRHIVSIAPIARATPHQPAVDLVATIPRMHEGTGEPADSPSWRSWRSVRAANRSRRSHENWSGRAYSTAFRLHEHPGTAARPSNQSSEQITKRRLAFDNSSQLSSLKSSFSSPVGPVAGTMAGHKWRCWLAERHAPVVLPLRAVPRNRILCWLAFWSKLHMWTLLRSMDHPTPTGPPSGMVLILSLGRYRSVTGLQAAPATVDSSDQATTNPRS